MFAGVRDSVAGNPSLQNSKYGVTIHRKPYPHESSGKDIIYASNWFSPCINAIACFNTYLNNPTDIHAATYYAAGVDFGKEWVTARKNAERYNLYHDSKNVNTGFQLSVINRLFNGESTYKIKNEIGKQSTVERLAKRFKEKFPFLTTGK